MRPFCSVIIVRCAQSLWIIFNNVLIITGKNIFFLSALVMLPASFNIFVYDVDIAAAKKQTTTN